MSRPRSVSLQKQSHRIDVKHLQLNDDQSALYEFQSTPASNVSKSSDFADILKQWKRINGLSGNKFDTKQEEDRMRKESEISNSSAHCNGFRTCRCIKRLMFIMGFYDEWCRKHEKKKICKGLSVNDIIEGLPCFDSTQLWNDFIHAKHCHFIQSQNTSIIETIQVWDYVESKLGIRDMTQCAKFARNNRNRTITGTEQQRKALYYGFSQSDEVIPIQLCDVIWEFLFHSKILFKNEFANKILYDPRKIEQQMTAAERKEDDIANADTNEYKARPRRASSIKEDTQDEFVYSDDEKKQFEAYIALKNEVLQRNIGDINGKEQHIIRSKFVTNVYDEERTSFGVSFVYWTGYNTWHTYISSATFSTLKEEMLNNPYQQITLYQWTDSLLKSITFKSSNIGHKWMAKNAGILNKRYDIRPGLPISSAHIISILFYVNYRDLQFAFKRNGCRKLKTTESTNEVKERNKNIGNWYKLFTECITLYGGITSKQEIFYHGLNKRILFDAFKPNFNCMISTTSSLSVAQCIIANNDGIIVKLQQKRSLPYGYLDVGWCSDFQNESEKIFSFSRLDIVDIYQNQPRFESNSIYVSALILFQSIVRGQYFEHTLHSDYRYQKVIICMIQNWMNTHHHNIPTYLQQLFNSFLAKQRKLYVIQSQYNHLYRELKDYLIDFDDDGSYEFGAFLNKIKEKNNNRLKLLLMKEFRWEVSGGIMNEFKALPLNNTIKGKYFHAGNDVVLYPRLRRSDRDFPDKSMMFCYVEDMPSDYKRIYIQWEIFCKEANYHSSHTQYLKKGQFAGYTVSDTRDLCCLDQFVFEIAVQILDIDK